jgi:hypothetical protein
MKRSSWRKCTTYTLRHLRAVLLVLLAVGTAKGQISIDNRSSTPVPRDRAWVIYQTTCQVVADRFHVKDSIQLQVPFHLNVGSEESNVLYDEGAGTYQINLSEWGDTKFAFAALRLTLQRLVTLESRREMLLETLARAERKLPVDSTKVRREVRPGSEAWSCTKAK